MKMETQSFQHDFDSAFAGIRQVREGFEPQLTPREVASSRMSPPESPRFLVFPALALTN